MFRVVTITAIHAAHRASPTTRTFSQVCRPVRAAVRLMISVMPFLPRNRLIRDRTVFPVPECPAAPARTSPACLDRLELAAWAMRAPGQAGKLDEFRCHQRRCGCDDH